MIRLLLRRIVVRSESIFKAVRPFSNSNAVSERLKIAYFGTDEFSVSSLAKLYAYKQANPDKIESIHVITRSVKSRGRKSKTFDDLPIGNYCAGRGDLPVIRADSLEEIKSILDNHRFNLTVAVSYGKLIPRLFLESCIFGGLNVHPSLLPRYSGSSPIQYALINDDKFTGCTIQTLHPTKFDQGDVILRSDEIPIAQSDNFISLQLKLGDLGGNLLLKVIDEDLFNQEPSEVKDSSKYEFSLASKITSSRNQILWNQMTARQIKRLSDALGPLHTYKLVDIVKKKQSIKELQKVIIIGVTEIPNFDVNGLQKPGLFSLNADKSILVIKTADGYIAPKSLKFQCCKEEVPLEFMRSLYRRCGSTPDEFVSLDTDLSA
jgi:methionyl-tRNA formyltransferase